MVRIAHLIVAFLMAMAAGQAQQSGLPIATEDYSKWGTLSSGGLSPDGRWASYVMRYENGRDTLFIQNTDGRTLYRFAGAAYCSFDPAGNSAAVSGPGDTLQWIALRSGKTLKFPSAGSYGFSPDGRKVLLLQSRGGNNGLSVSHPDGKQDLWIPDVREYALSGNNLAISGGSGLLLANLGEPGKGNSTILQGVPNSYSGLAWSPSGERLAFFESPEGSSPIALHCCVLSNGMRKKISTTQLSGLGSYKFSGQKAVFSKDGSKIYFTVMPAPDPQPENRVEVWETDSRYEYPQEEFLRDPAAGLQLAIWDTATGDVQLAGREGTEDPKMLPGDRYIISRKPLPNTDPVQEVGDADYYISETGSDQPPRFLWKASMEDEAVRASPDGRYLAYFDGAGYRVTDLSTLSTSSIASGQRRWASEESDYPGRKPAYGSPGFTADSRWLILYDAYDIWIASADGKELKKITDGRPARTRYRIDRESHVLAPPSIAKWTLWELNLEKGLVLEATRSDKTLGYGRYSSAKGFSEFLAADGKLSDLSRSAKGDSFLYLHQSSATPPRLVWKSGKKKARVLYQSNSHYLNYQWPKLELLRYQNREKDTLEGILIYPAGYQPSRKYPMVVYIYERLSQGLHEYSAPKPASLIGFSPASYFLDGYFVLLPDLKFRTGDPGPSALECIEAAVGSAMQRGAVDENRLGIIGHSFGGYLSSYVASNSKLFAAAVSGAGVSDMTSSYLTMNFARSRSNNWRFESQQYRMGSTPFDNPEGYLRNSPITRAASISTPLLLWAGKSDTSVDFRQSVEMHLALRRLGKESVMLLYPEQGHILTRPDAQADLTARVKEWFDGYLKTP